MAGGEPHRRAARGHLLAEPEGHRRDPVAGDERRGRVEVLRAGGAGDVRVEPVPVGKADDPLQDDRHLFLLQPVGGAVEEIPDAGEEQRGIDLPDGPAEGLQPVARRPGAVREQQGLVHPAERQVGGVLQQAGGADRHRIPHRLGVAAEIAGRLLGEGGAVEALPQFGLALGFEGEGEEVVLLQEAVEDAGGEDHRLRHRDYRAGVPVGDSGTAEHGVREGEAARLAAHGTAADAQEGRARIESLAGEVGDHRAAPLPPVLPELAADVAADVVARPVVADPHLPEAPGHLELPPRHQPVGDLVVAGVVDQTLARRLGERLLEGVEVGGAEQLGPVRHPEDEVAEVEPLAHQPADLAQQVPRSLEQEIGPGAAGERFVLGPARVEDRRDVGTLLPHGGHEALSRLRIPPAAAGVLDVRDHPEDLVRIGGELVPRLFVAVAEEDLGAAPDAVELLAETEAFGEQLAGLLEDGLVDDRQERGVVADAVLDQQDGGDAAPAGVVRRVVAVLDLFHDRQEDADIALPDERFFQPAAPVPTAVFADGPGVVTERRHPGAPAVGAEAPGEGPDVHVAEVRRGDHQLEAGGVRRKALQRLGSRGDLGHARQDAQVQVEEPGEDAVVELAVLGEDETSRSDSARRGLRGS